MGATYDGPVIEVMKAGVPEVPVEMVPNPLPFGTVMTLPATGSEMNNGAVITYGDGKFPVFSLSLIHIFQIPYKYLLDFRSVPYG